MIESLKSEITKHGDKVVIVPVHHLLDIRQDLRNLQDSEDLNNFQRYIMNDLYTLDVPDADFEIRSILVAASPGHPSINLKFSWKGKCIQALLPATYVEKDRAPMRIEKYLNELLNPTGYHVSYAPQLPRKRIAVRSGLAEYGRNNICYVEGMGSFLNLSLFFSDIPSLEDPWREVRQMDACRTCRACLENCPTGAIMPTRFLIDNQRCLTYFNEAGAEWNFPEWIHPSAHHTLYGCLRCQSICPANRPYLSSAPETVAFSEDETAQLMEGKSIEHLPVALRQKVKALEMGEYLGAVPRNLRAIFNRAA